mmetsp:Transcript_38284/g.121915  ORF Transcript_38284/g.121915 Transcript_38284/m.121915 type:complete len:924 (-) Transcript_38284:32-2803(-)
MPLTFAPVDDRLALHPLARRRPSADADSVAPSACCGELTEVEEASQEQEHRGVLLVERGRNTFAQKALHAAAGGYDGVVVYNNVEGPLFRMAGGPDAEQLPPALLVSHEAMVAMTSLMKGRKLTIKGIEPCKKSHSFIAIGGIRLQGSRSATRAASWQSAAGGSDGGASPSSPSLGSGTGSASASRAEAPAAARAGGGWGPLRTEDGSRTAAGLARAALALEPPALLRDPVTAARWQAQMATRLPGQSVWEAVQGARLPGGPPRPQEAAAPRNSRHEVAAQEAEIWLATDPRSVTLGHILLVPPHGDGIVLAHSLSALMRDILALDSRNAAHLAQRAPGAIATLKAGAGILAGSDAIFRHLVQDFDPRARVSSSLGGASSSSAPAAASSVSSRMEGTWCWSSGEYKLRWVARRLSVALVVVEDGEHPPEQFKVLEPQEAMSLDAALETAGLSADDAEVFTASGSVDVLAGPCVLIEEQLQQPAAAERQIRRGFRGADSIFDRVKCIAPAYVRQRWQESVDGSGNVNSCTVSVRGGQLCVKWSAASGYRGSFQKPLRNLFEVFAAVPKDARRTYMLRPREKVLVACGPAPLSCTAALSSSSVGRGGWEEEQGLDEPDSAWCLRQPSTSSAAPASLLPPSQPSAAEEDSGAASAAADISYVEAHEELVVLRSRSSRLGLGPEMFELPPRAELERLRLLPVQWCIRAAVENSLAGSPLRAAGPAAAPPADEMDVAATRMMANARLMQAEAQAARATEGLARPASPSGAAEAAASSAGAEGANDDAARGGPLQGPRRQLEVGSSASSSASSVPGSRRGTEQADDSSSLDAPASPGSGEGRSVQRPSFELSELEGGELEVKVRWPGIRSARELRLEVAEQSMHVSSVDGPPEEVLAIELPRPSAVARAVFKRALGALVVTLAPLAAPP